MKKQSAILAAAITNLLVIAFMLAIGLNAYYNTGSASVAQSPTAASVADIYTTGSAVTQQELALGILRLQGTSLAITASQARALLPLWQALQSLSSSNNTTPAEIDALSLQMVNLLNPAQVIAIQNMTWQQSDLRSLARQYNVQLVQRGNVFSYNQLFADAVISLLQQKV